MNSKKILLFIICCFQINFLFAQPLENISPGEQYRAVHWNIEDGLSAAGSFCMLKDVKGFLWISTGYGLNRFDGSRFKNYFAGSRNNATISDGGRNDQGVQAFGNFITTLKEDSLHNIWIGTDAGLQRYDIKADTFTIFLPSVDSTDIGAIPFQATKDEMYCMDASGWIVAYNIHSFTKKFLMKLPAEFVGHYVRLYYTIFDSESNSIWLLGDGLLAQISLSTGKSNRYVWKCFKNIPHDDHNSEGMRYDGKRNCIWINSNDGLVQFTLADKKFHHVDAIDKLPSIKGYDTDFVRLHWVGIDMDTQGRVWAATVEKGIIVYDPSAQTAFQPVEDNDNTGKEISDKNAVLYCDREGIVWTGYWANKGIYELLPYSQSVKRYTSDTTKPFSLSSNIVNTFAPADHGRVWIGTGDGINIFDTQKETFEALHEKDLPGVVIRGNLAIISVDTIAHKAFIQDDVNGLFQIDTRTRKCTRLIFKDSANKIILPDYCPRGRPFKNAVIVPAFYDNNFGIFIVNSDSIVAHEILCFPKLDEPYVLNDGHNIYLKSTQEKYNFTYTNQNGRWTQISSGFDTIQGMKFFFNEPDRSYWVVGNKQLIHFDKTFKTIHAYTSKDGLPNSYIFGWITDKYGNCWFNTDRSIFRVDIKTGIIRELTDKDGLPKQMFGACGRDNNGELYFASYGSVYDGHGFDRVDPDKFQISYPPATVYFQSLEISQKPFPGSTGVNNLQNLSLKYFENKITIETGIIDYYSKGKGRIRYKLDARGENADWQYAPDYYTIRYEDLQPGKYTLIMQAGNAANEFNGPEKTLLINISPAFWNTWWFRLVAVLCIIAIIYGVLRWRLQQRFRLKLERSEKETQLAEMRQKSTEMEMQALRAQMNPHFIFNSLNSINRFILKEQTTDASEYLTKFSRLIRMILQNSQASLITLESELESLELYLTLEVLRFDYQFAYKISLEDDVDTSALKVPPLIIQPYVENAIWHGLMHKEEKGELVIAISQDDAWLYITITDDGIGRKKASELASKSATKHKSMGLKITAHRIAMMQAVSPDQSIITINDLVGPDGSAAGTEVIIKLPAIYD